MATIKQYFEFAQLAQATYGDLSGLSYGNAVSLRNRLSDPDKNADFTTAQAEQFTSSTTGYALRDHTSNDLFNGFSASLFESNANPGEFTLALRGTEPTDPRDLLSDIDLAATGLARDQIVSMYRYYKQLITPAGQAVAYSSAELLTLAGIKDFTGTPLATSASYLALLAATSFDTGLGKLSPTAKINIVGHSLGGNLAMAFVNLLPNAVAHAYTFNGAGLGGAGIELIDRLTGVQSSVASSLVTNLVADPDNDFTAGVGTVLGETKRAFIEKQSLAVSDHSMVLLTDSLALQSLFVQIDPSLTLDKLNTLLKAASADPAQSLETTLDKLRTLFEQNYVYGNTHYNAVPTFDGGSVASRDDYYTKLYALQAAIGSQPFTTFHVESLAGKSSSQLAQLAQSDSAYRYALVKLNQFVVTGSSALYDSINAHGELDLVNPATGQGELSAQYLKDRALFLADLIIANTADQTENGSTWLKTNGATQYFEDTSGYVQTRLYLGADNSITAQPLGGMSQIKFGGWLDDTMIGDSQADHLYGMAGNDTLNGGDGNDSIEGNQGDDLLYGGFGNDTLVGGNGFDTYRTFANEGFDTVLDSDGLGVIKFGAIKAIGSDGLDPAQWLHPTGSDTWIDQQNGIAYTRSVVRGETQLLIHKGDSNVLVKGWAEGNLGIALGAGSTLPEPATLLTGTALGNYLEAAPGGQRVEGLAGADMIHGSAGIDHLLGGDGGDWIVGYGGADHIEGGAGNDYITGIGANSLADGGDGNDILSAFGSDWFTVQGPNNPITAEVFWADSVSKLFTPDYSVYSDSNGDPTFEYGAFPVNAAYSGASSLGGGWTYQFTVANGSWDVKYFHPQTAPDGIRPAAYWEEGIQGQTLTESVFLQGGAGDDLLIGNNGSDVLDGGTGQDNLFGIDGDDVLDGGAEADILAGGIGADVLIGGAGTDTLFGEAGDDILLGGTEDDALVGGAGNDVLDGGAGADTLRGGVGNDTYLGVAGGDEIFDIEGDSIIVLTVASLGAGGLSASLQTNADGNQYMQLAVALDTGDALKLDSPFFADGSTTLQFANGNTLDLETLVGSTLTTPLNLLLGDTGGRVYGGAGADFLNGGSGNDTLVGHDGNDTLSSRAGDDVLDGGAGDDTLYGGAGNDTYIYSGGRDTLIDSQPGNTLTFNTAPGALTLGFQTSLYGTQDLSLTLADGSGVTIRDGFLGVIDTFNLGGTRQSIDLLLDTYLSQAVSIIGTAADNRVYGGAGGDVLSGLAGDDALYGGRGDDTLDGGDGADSLVGGRGDDLLAGGAGSDTYRFGINDGSDTVIAAAPSDTNADVLQLGAGITAADLAGFKLANGDLLLRINGTQDSVKFEGWFTSGPGVATVRFADNSELSSAAISALAVEGLGGTGLGDVLTGTAANDHLLGYGGNDMLTGGAGDDVLEGGAGADIYRFGWSSLGADTVVEQPADASTILLTEGAGLADMKHARVGNDLQIALRSTSATLTLKDYFVSSQTWTIQDGGGATTSVADWLALPVATADIQSVRADFLEEARALWASGVNASALYKRVDGDTYQAQWTNTGGSNTAMQNFTVLNSASDAASVFRQSFGENFASTRVEITRAPTGGTAIMPTYISLQMLETLLLNGGGIETDWLIPVYGPSEESSLIVGVGQSLIGFSTLISGPVPSNAIPHYFNTTTTFDTQVEQIIGGDSDNVILGNVLAPNPYSPGNLFPYSPGNTVTLIDGGGGNDIIYAPGFFGVPDIGLSSIGGLSSFLYGNTGDDKLYGSGARDTLAGGAGSDYLDGSAGADTYLVFAGDAGTDVYGIRACR